MNRHNFALSMIGTPHVIGGRDENGIDCWGLVVAYYKDVLNINLPDWDATKYSQNDIFRTLTEESKSRMLWIDSPEDDAILFGYRGSIAVHVGVYFGGGVLHCFNKGSVVYQRSRIAQITFGNNCRYGFPK